MTIAVKNQPANLGMQETQVQSLGQEDPLENKWQPTPVFLPRKLREKESWWAIIHGVTKSNTAEHVCT